MALSFPVACLSDVDASDVTWVSPCNHQYIVDFETIDYILWKLRHKIFIDDRYKNSMIIDIIVKWQRWILECPCKHFITTTTTSTTVTTTTHVLYLLSEKSKLYWYMYDMQITLKFLCISRLNIIVSENPYIHDDVIKWKHFPRYWPFVRGNHRSPVTSPHKGQWRGTLMFSLICE